MCYEGNKYIRNQISTYEKKYQNPPLYQVPSGLDQVVPVREREREGPAPECASSVDLQRLKTQVVSI